MADLPAPPAAPGADSVVELDGGGRRYRLHLPDAATDYIQKKIATERQPYELEMLEDIRARVAPGDLVLDVGANVGNHSLYLAAVAGCRVDAFEPNASLCAAMRSSVALNALEDRVRIHPVGVGSGPGRAGFDKALPENLGAQRLALGGGGDIEVVALDALAFAQPVKVLKVDVEGMELQVLHGADALIRRDRPIVYVECIGEREARDVSRWLDERGYGFWERFNATPTYLFVPGPAASTDRMLSRLLLKAELDETRTALLATNVRQKLTRAYDNEREAKQRVADLSLEVSGLRTERAALAANAQRTGEALRAAQAEVEGLAAKVRQTGEALRAAGAERDGLAARLQQTNEALRIATAERDGLAARLQQTDEALRVAGAERDGLAAKVRQTDDALRAAGAERDGLAAMLRQTDEALRVAGAERDGLAARLRQTDEALRVAAAERDGLAGRLDAVLLDVQRLEQAGLALQAQLETLRNAHRQASEHRDRLQGELRASQDGAEKLRLALAASAQRLATVEATSDRERIGATARAAALEREITELHRDLAESQRALRVKTSRLAVTEKRLERVTSSTSYLVGTALAGGVKSVPAALRLPGQLWMILRSSRTRRLARQNAAAAPAAAPPEVVALPSRAPGTVVPRLPPRAALGRRAVRDLTQLSDLRVACIFDEFSFHSFAPECQFLQLRSDTWQQQVEAFEPDLVFIESAWRGADDTWMKKVSDASTELLALVDWALARGVATAFWCKEDPVHFARFLPVARLVDHVFTTDIDCIRRYKDALKHERVHLLPFAAQPAMHNPVETVPRADAFCFAGSYYPHYAERQVDFRNLVRVGRRLRSVEIFDRNANRPQPHDFNFPDEYLREIRGHLPYTEMDRAYKGYRYGITVNTIKQSQTMFARRALELMACNTVVVSNFSKGLRLLFGDLVISSDSPVELEHRLAPLCADENEYRRHRLRALRKVLAEHTCEHRLADVASKLLGRSFAAVQPRICMLGEPADADDAARLFAAYARQTAPRADLVLVACPIAPPAGLSGVRRVAGRGGLAAQLAGYDYVAPVVAADYHGPDYLLDLVLATRFARGDGVTKAACFAPTPDGSVALVGDGRQYRPVDTAALRRSLLRTAALHGALADPAARLETASVASASLIAVDEFSYCLDAQAVPGFDPRAVDVPGLLRPGARLVDDVLRLAERITVPEFGNETEGPLVLAAADWHRLLPKEIDKRLEIRLEGDAGVVVRSTLEGTDHQYLYLTRRFSPAELKAERETFFQLEADARLELRTVFVFHDANDKKLSHAMHTVGARYGLQVPAATASIRLALRIQGSGQATLGRLTLAETRGLPPQVIPTARHLIVANQYPGYDDLYRYGFVHARARAYARESVTAEVLRLSQDPKVVYREFEDVDVTEADHAHFDACLAGGHYDSVLIHIADHRMWAVVRPHLDKVRVVIWAHGAEIQPWWRRAMNQPTDALRDQARRTSDARLAMWREILTLRHPNLGVVFISHKQAAEALSDLRLRSDDVAGIEVIPNYINGELFRYAPKPAAQRHRILSIRPFASPVYANDLSVAAIVHLAREPFFDQLHFKIVGDGVLFEQTVAPLRDLPNVEVTRAFLTQRQIAELHRDYGVFLVPSRMDSQGVSRDEAMASGLVPVTTRIAAIPEFVDERCGLLSEPEDATGLAQAIGRLHAEPALFESLSAAAARRVRAQSGHAQTIARELALFAGTAAVPAPAPTPSPLQRFAADEAAVASIALYGDVNLNVMDGSAIWAASLAEVLGGIAGVRVSLLLKARIHRTQVIARLLDLAPAVQLIEPAIPEKLGLSPAEAAAELVALDAVAPFRSFILRGLDVCFEASSQPPLHGRIWAYLTDIPQQAHEMDAPTRTRIDAIVAASEHVLCQTPQMLAYFVGQFPLAQAKALLLPPMVPPPPRAAGTAPSSGPLRLCYAGKFAPRWGIRELFAAFDALRTVSASAQLHVYGDKIHKPADDPEFHPLVLARLKGGEGIEWHGAVDRDELLRNLPTMHACWAFRDPAFERETLELSTKALEYASLGVPTILARSPVIETVFGSGYLLFADSAADAARLLLRLAAEPALRDAAAAQLAEAASRYTFAAVREQLIAEGLLAKPQPPAGNAGPPSAKPLAETLVAVAP